MTEVQKRNKTIVFEKITLYLFGAIMAIYQLICCNNNAIWCDEAYSVDLARASFRDTIYQTAIDVHPPLHYIELKILGRLFGFHGFVIHLAAWIPFFLLLLVTVTLFYKKFGFEASFIFLLLVTCIPCSVTNSTQIRMYSLAIFLVTMCFYYEYEIVNEPKKSNWILMTFFGIAAAYSHYFAFAAVCAIYGCLFLTLLFTNKKQLKNFAICSFLSLVSYAPWLSYFIKSIIRVNKGFWVSEVPGLWECISFLFGDGLCGVALFGIYIITLLLIVLSVFGIGLKKLHISISDKESIGVLTAFFVNVIVFLFGIGYSILIRPMFLSRYLYTFAGVVWLGFSIGLSKITKRKIVFIVVAAVILGFNISNIASKLVFQNKIDKETIETVNYIEENYDDSTIMISNWGQFTDRIFDYYLPDKLGEDWDSANWTDIANFQTVYFFGDSEMSDEYVNILHQNGFNEIVLLKETYLGRYPVYLYYIAHGAN